MGNAAVYVEAIIRVMDVNWSDHGNQEGKWGEAIHKQFSVFYIYNNDLD